MNKIEVFIVYEPTEIQREVERFCERYEYNPLNISVTYDSRYKVYTVIAVLEKG